MFSNYHYVKPGHRVVRFGWVSYIIGGIGTVNEKLCVQIYIQPGGGISTKVGNKMTYPRRDHAACRVGNGKIIVSGGCITGSEDAVECYDTF